MKDEGALSAGYAPPAAVIEVVTRYRDRGLTTPITTEVLERAGVQESLSRRTLQAIKQLGFVGEDGEPTDEFEALTRAPEADFKQRLGEMITAAYADVFKFADPATDSYDAIRDAFRPYNPKGQQERMITMFLGLCEYAGLDVGAAMASRRSDAGTSRSSAPRATASPRRSTSATKGGGKGHSGPPPSAQDAALLAWFNTRPDPSDGWAHADRDRFMMTLRALIDGVYAEPADEEDAVA
jgi:hypothetical protein